MAFLGHAKWGGARRAPLAGDASFRRYERLELDGRTAMLMDAPPEHEDVRPFWAIAGYLLGLGLSAPNILDGDIENGFLLLEDLGDDLFVRVVERAAGPGEEQLYGAAVDVLLSLHGHDAPESIPIPGGAHKVPAHDHKTLLAEANLFVEWYLPALTGADVAESDKAEYEALWLDLFGHLAWPRPVLVLRDYHAENLIWLPERDGLAKVGLLDFQDAAAGHPAFDLMSLLEDARRDVAPDLAAKMLDRYIAAASARTGDFDEAAFRRAYAILGAQRNAKIVGIFTRLWRRDGKPEYLKFLPRVWVHLDRNLDHVDLAPLRDWIGERVPLDAERRALTGAS